MSETPNNAIIEADKTSILVTDSVGIFFKVFIFHMET